MRCVVWVRLIGESKWKPLAETVPGVRYLVGPVGRKMVGLSSFGTADAARETMAKLQSGMPEWWSDVSEWVVRPVVATDSRFGEL